MQMFIFILEKIYFLKLISMIQKVCKNIFIRRTMIDNLIMTNIIFFHHFQSPSMAS